VSQLPGAFRRTHEEALRDEVAEAAGTTPSERAEILVSLCRLAVEQILQHPDPARVLDYQDPIPASSKAALQRLRERYERTRRAASGS
jgi:hypothetical protein